MRRLEGAGTPSPLTDQTLNISFTSSVVISLQCLPLVVWLQSFRKCNFCQGENFLGHYYETREIAFFSTRLLLVKIECMGWTIYWKKGSSFLGHFNDLSRILGNFLWTWLYRCLLSAWVFTHLISSGSWAIWSISLGIWFLDISYETLLSHSANVKN